MKILVKQKKSQYSQKQIFTPDAKARDPDKPYELM